MADSISNSSLSGFIILESGTKSTDDPWGIFSSSKLDYWAYSTSISLISCSDVSTISFKVFSFS
jgi:hypothetical protein